MVDCNTRAIRKLKQNQWTIGLTPCREAIFARQKLQRFRIVKNRSLTKPARLLALPFAKDALQGF
jgi:hypothetical protein